MSISKSDLLEGLRTSGDEVLSQLKNLPEDEFSGGRYENGWNGKQILAHVSSIEWTYTKLIGLTLNPVETKSPKPSSTDIKGGINSYNDRQVAKRDEWSISELLAEFEKNRAATIASVEELDDDALAREVTSSAGFQGPLADVLNYVAVVHVRQHVADIVGAGA